MDKIINTVASKIVAYFACNNYIPRDNEEIYRYGVVVFLQSTITIISMLIIGLLFGCFFENICFLIVLKLLRNFSGGLHSSKFAICYLISILSNIVILILLWLFELYGNDLIMIFFEIISVFVIAIFAPIANKNKPVTSKEARIYKIIAAILSVLFIIASVVLMSLNSNYATIIGLTMILNSMFVIAEKILNAIMK